MENSNDNSRVIGALLIGAIAGAAAGILFAPEKGSKIRNKLVSGAKELADDFKKTLKDEATALRLKVKELEELAKDKIHELGTSVKQKVDGVKHTN
jgi:gas vesicle protein